MELHDGPSAPTVISTLPADFATNVPVNHDVVVVFSEWMNPATLNNSTFTLTHSNLKPVKGVVSTIGETAVFVPKADLAANKLYTASIATGGADLAGNHLGVAFIWSFTTGTTQSNGPAAVSLGTAENYVILAKSGVSTTGATAIVGDLGLSPAAATAYTGFSLTMDASNEFSTSPLVTGRLYAADYSFPTSSNLTTAVLDMEAAYTDAAGRTLPDFTELGAGNIDGLTLVPGLYKWGSVVEIPTGATLAGGANDVWIFQIAQGLTVGSGAIVTLTGGALPENIFWQVAGQTTLGTTSDFNGIVLCKTEIVVNTGATVNGRLLAQTAVTLDANSIVAP